MPAPFQLLSDGAVPVTGADISLVRDATDGSLFWSCQVSQGTGQPPVQVVYRQTQTGVSRLPLTKNVTGRGQLAVMAGMLWLIAWNEGESPRKGYCIHIPECQQPDLITNAASDPRVDSLLAMFNALNNDNKNLHARIDALQQKLVEIETALGNVSGDTLRELLRAWLGIPD